MNSLDFSKYSILVIGDVMLDKYIYGSVSRISPEAPVPVVDVKETSFRLGGAANVALNLVCLGAKATLIGMRGADDAGSKLSTLLNQRGIVDRLFVSHTSRPTTVKTRVVARNQQLLRVDSEDKSTYDKEDQLSLKSKIEEAFSANNYSYVILQDYNKGLFSKETIYWITEQCNQHNIPYAVDPKYLNAEQFTKADIFKPNLKEASNLATKIAGAELADINEIGRVLIDKLSCRTLFITRSSEGIYYQGEGVSGNEPTQKREILDVCGAGDAVISTIVLARLAKFSLADMAKLANIAGGQVCEKPTVVPVFVKDLSEEWSSLKMDNTDN